MIEERLMEPGGFDLRLKEGTPLSVTDQIQELGYIVVTPGRAEPASVSELLAQAIYTGVLRRMGDARLDLDGAHLMIVLGDENNFGDIFTDDTQFYTGSPSSPATDLAFAVGEVLAWGNGITAGQIKTVATFAAGLTDADAGTGLTPRQIFTDWANGTTDNGHFFDADVVTLKWRVNPDGTFDLDDPEDLFHITPRVLITDIPAGTGRANQADGAPNSAAVEVIRADEIDIVEVDTTEYENGTYYFVAGNYDAGNEATDARPYMHLGGSELIMRKSVATDSGFGALAAGIVGQIVYDQNPPLVFREIDVDLSDDLVHSPREFIEPGDYLYFQSLRNRLTDTDNHVLIDGELWHPVALPVFAVKYPITEQMGVFHITPTNPLRVVDLSEWFEPEDDSTSLEVGRPSPTLTQIYGTASGGNR